MAKKPKQSKGKGGKNPSRPASKADSRGLKGIFDDEYAKRAKNPKPRPPSEGVPPRAAPPPPNSKMLAPQSQMSPVIISEPPAGSVMEPAPTEAEALEALAKKYGPSMVPEGFTPTDPNEPMARMPNRAPIIPSGMAALGPLAGMIGAGMAIPSATARSPDEDVLGLISEQSGTLGGPQISPEELQQLLMEAQSGNTYGMGMDPDTDNATYDAIVPGGPGDGGGVMPAAMRADKPTGLSEQDLMRILQESGQRVSARPGNPPTDPNTPGYGDPMSIMTPEKMRGRGGQAPDDIMTRIMLEEMGR